MEEKNLTEAQVAEQTTSQEVQPTTPNYKRLYEDAIQNLNDAQDCANNLNADNERLEAQNAELIEKLKTAENSLDWNRKQYMEYMSQRDILKKTLEEICKRKNVSTAEMYEAMMTANDMDIDSVLTKLGKPL